MNPASAGASPKALKAATPSSMPRAAPSKMRRWSGRRMRGSMPIRPAAPAPHAGKTPPSGGPCALLARQEQALVVAVAERRHAHREQRGEREIEGPELEAEVPEGALHDVVAEHVHQVDAVAHDADVRDL